VNGYGNFDLIFIHCATYSSFNPDKERGSRMASERPRPRDSRFDGERGLVLFGAKGELQIGQVRAL